MAKSFLPRSEATTLRLFLPAHHPRDSIYTFRNPSNFNTSPSAMNFLFVPETDMVAVVFSSLASLIWEAIVRFQISSYSLFSVLFPSTNWLLIYVGLMASWASWAPFDFWFYNSGYLHILFRIHLLMVSSAAVRAVLERFTESVLIYVINPAS